MVDDGRECRDVATQFAAATQALRRAGYQFVSQTLAHCLADPDGAADEGYTPDELERLFLRL
jgi:DNA-binding FrmR family transcriptional regulator